ncbi:hypothetical protein DM860_012208 [Cuscuta australis]|uniref:Uncharacterized protein n=1 Tax=Cuscuta australis TaxID=267555 RepID=A0A328EAK2_9ASTE|nr:hypothetical protein DM860_012208 [Cuscuta australis]
MVIHDPTMPSFKLLSNSNEETPFPLPTPTTLNFVILKYDSGDSRPGTSDPDLTWWSPAVDPGSSELFSRFKHRCSPEFVGAASQTPSPLLSPVQRHVTRFLAGFRWLNSRRWFSRRCCTSPEKTGVTPVTNLNGAAARR